MSRKTKAPMVGPVTLKSADVLTAQPRLFEPGSMVTIQFEVVRWSDNKKAHGEIRVLEFVVPQAVLVQGQLDVAGLLQARNQMLDQLNGSILQEAMKEAAQEQEAEPTGLSDEAKAAMVLTLERLYEESARQNLGQEAAGPTEVSEPLAKTETEPLDD